MQLTRNLWKSYTETIHAFSATELSRPGLSAATVTFLKGCGLPADCEPCLAFEKFVDNKHISTVNEVLGTSDKELDNYLMIGTNGSGAPVCIDLARKNEIVYLDHDQHFERVFINASIVHFAQCLVSYQDFLAAENGGRRFTDTEMQHLKSLLRKADRRALDDGSFWNAELEYLEWERGNA
jgi:hypothetical protein